MNFRLYHFFRSGVMPLYLKVWGISVLCTHSTMLSLVILSIQIVLQLLKTCKFGIFLIL